MTLVSIKYTRRLAGGVDTLEIRVVAHVGHRSKNGRKTALARPAQCRCQDFAVLRFRTAAVRHGTLFQRLDHCLVDATNKQICHRSLLEYWVLSMIAAAPDQLCCPT